VLRHWERALVFAPHPRILRPRPAPAESRNGQGKRHAYSLMRHLSTWHSCFHPRALPPCWSACSPKNRPSCSPDCISGHITTPRIKGTTTLFAAKSSTQLTPTQYCFCFCQFYWKVPCAGPAILFFSLVCATHSTRCSSAASLVRTACGSVSLCSFHLRQL
jgi:hypothetical protein